MPDLYLLEHPGVLLPSRSPELRDLFGLDFRRLAKLATGWRPPVPVDDFQVVETWEALRAWLEAVPPGVRLALDLETQGKGTEPDMVGLASSAERACLMPLPNSEALAGLVQWLVAQQAHLIVHYGEGLEVDWLLDVCWGMDPVDGGDLFAALTIHDLGKLFHAYDPEYASAGRDKGPGGKRGGGSGALAFIQSIYAWRPYHKHLLAQAKGDFAKKARYCMLDCVVEWECFHRLEVQAGQQAPAALAAYHRDAVPLLPIMVRMSRAGVPVDRARFEGRRDALRLEVVAQGDALVAEWGNGIRPKGKKAKWPVSLEAVKTTLTASGIRLPRKRDPETGVWKPTLDREARRKLVGEYPELGLLGEYLSNRDVLTDFYKPGIISKDGLCHSHWSGYLASWRWRDTDPNLAQHPAKERRVFRAPPGHVLVESDTISGEYGWFAGECQDPLLLEEMRAFYATGDVLSHPMVIATAHAFNVGVDQAAAWKASHDPAVKARYTFSKNNSYRRVYAYRGGIDSLKGPCAKAGLKWSKKLFQDLDVAWFQRYPQAAVWRHRHVAQCRQTRLAVCREWGYVRRLHGQQGPEVDNAGLNHPMQAGIAGVVNRAIRLGWQTLGLVPLVNMHDGKLDAVPEDGIGTLNFNGCVHTLQALMQPPLVTLGGLVIPVEVRTGQWWGLEMREWKGGAP